MKRILAALALLGLAFVATADAQLVPFPQSLPPNTVVGRLGISAGPAQAVPFANLRSNLGVAPFGTVLMGRSVLGTGQLWTAYDQTGAVFSTGTETSDCPVLRAALSYAKANGLPLIVQGGGITVAGGVSTDPTRITCTSTLTIGPLQGGSIEVHGVTLILSPSTASNDGAVIDTTDFSSLRFFGGQILYTGTGSAIHVQPTTTNGEISNTYIGNTSSAFVFPTIVCIVSNLNFGPDGTKGIGLRLSAVGGTIDGNFWHTEEINACLVGRQIDNATGAFSVNANTFEEPNVHAQGSTSSVIGTSGSGVNIFDNNFRGFYRSAAGNISVWGINNRFDIGIDGGTTGIVLNTSAAGNLCNLARNTASTPLTNGASVDSNIGCSGPPATNGTTTTVMHGAPGGPWTFGSVVNNDIANTTIQNAKLANSSITIGGASTALGGTVTATTILSQVCTTQGDILYYNGTSWVCLATGTSGQHLQTQGASANPVWGSVRQMWGGNCGTTGVAQNSTVFCPAPISGAAAALTAATLMPFTGSVKNLYVQANAAPGAGQTFTYTVNKTGSDQTLTCQMSGAGQTTCNDTTHSFTFVAGDYLSVKVAVSVTATTNATHSFGMEIDNP